MIVYINQQINYFLLFYCKGKECKSWLLKWVGIALFNFIWCIAHHIICLRLLVYRRANMCGHYFFLNPPCFIIVWCGTFRSDFSHAQNKYGGSLDLKLLHIPGMSAGLITAILSNLFHGVLPIKNSETDSDELNEYLHLKIISAKGSINCPLCFRGCPVSVVLGSFTHQLFSLQEHRKIHCWKYSNKRLTKAEIEFLQQYKGW